jgi:fucose permease
VLVTHTQKTLGDRHGSNAIGIQMAAASLGVGTIPWVAGVAANAAGLDAIAIVVVALFVLLTLLVLFLGRVGRMFAASGGR